jgi:hypothetical protein
LPAHDGSISERGGFDIRKAEYAPIVTSVASMQYGPAALVTLIMLLGHGWHVTAQLPASQSASNLHVAPVPHFLHEPPQSTSVSVWFFTRSVQFGAWQARLEQTPLVQSFPTRHPMPSAQGGHEPPQSFAVSDPLRTPSKQVGTTQTWSVPQMPLAQSRGKRHRLPSAQGAQEGPPQSTSLSAGPR